MNLMSYFVVVIIYLCKIEYFILNCKLVLGTRECTKYMRYDHAIQYNSIFGIFNVLNSSKFNLRKWQKWDVFAFLFRFIVRFVVVVVKVNFCSITFAQLFRNVVPTRP